MLKRLIPHSVMYVFLGAACLMSSSGYSDNGNPHVYPYPPNSYQFYDRNPNSTGYYYSGREELNYTYPRETPYYTGYGTYGRDSTIAQRGDPYKLRSWNWDYKENWREDKDVFYSGGTQTSAMQRDFRYERPPGIGDPDDAYWLDPQFYRRPYYDARRGYNLNYTNYPPYSTYYNQNPVYPNQRSYNQTNYYNSY